jgi:hypothetical protein
MITHLCIFGRHYLDTFFLPSAQLGHITQMSPALNFNACRISANLKKKTGKR